MPRSFGIRPTEAGGWHHGPVKPSRLRFFVRCRSKLLTVLNTASHVGHCARSVGSPFFDIRPSLVASAIAASYARRSPSSRRQSQHDCPTDPPGPSRSSRVSGHRARRACPTRRRTGLRPPCRTLPRSSPFRRQLLLYLAVGLFAGEVLIGVLLVTEGVVCRVGSAFSFGAFFGSAFFAGGPSLQGLWPCSSSRCSSLAQPFDCPSLSAAI